MQHTSQEISAIIRLACVGSPANRQTGQRQLRQRLAQSLGTWFEVRTNDPVVPCPISAWRAPEREQYAAVAPRARNVALSLYRGGALCALIDIERRLDYVHSLARAADGRFFHSCKGLERLAVAAYAVSRQHCSRTDADAQTVTRELAAIASNCPADHNPAGLALILIVQRSLSHPELITPRLHSLAAAMIHGELT